MDTWLKLPLSVLEKDPAMSVSAWKDREYANGVLQGYSQIHQNRYFQV